MKKIFGHNIEGYHDEWLDKEDGIDENLVKYTKVLYNLGNNNVFLKRLPDALTSSSQHNSRSPQGDWPQWYQ
jgi:hypothetical protein